MDRIAKGTAKEGMLIVDSLRAWGLWQIERPAEAHSSQAGSVYPGLLLRFITETGRKPLDDYGWDDVYGFITTRKLGSLERRHYARAAESFFMWRQERSLVAGKRPRKARELLEGGRLLKRFAAAVLTPETGSLSTSIMRTLEPLAPPRERTPGNAHQGAQDRSRLRSLVLLILTLIGLAAMELGVAAGLAARFGH